MCGPKCTNMMHLVGMLPYVSMGFQDWFGTASSWFVSQALVALEGKPVVTWKSIDGNSKARRVT